MLFSETSNWQEKLITYLITTGLLAGCAGAPFRIGMLDEEGLAHAQVSDLCWAYVHSDVHDSKIRRELERRDAFTAKEWRAIDEHKIFVGMSEKALQCSWDMPDVFAFLTGIFYVSSEGPWGTRSVYLFGYPFDNNRPAGASVTPGPWPKKVYVENGMIVAFQESSDVVESDCLKFRVRKCFDFDGLVSSTVSDSLLQ